MDTEAAAVTEVVFRPRDHYRADGTPKVAFTTKKEAKRVARRMNGAPHPYRCHHCGQWHIGRTQEPY